MGQSRKQNCEPIQASSESFDCEQSQIKDHPCAEHCYDFECNLRDSCDNADGTEEGNIAFGTDASGVPNLGKYLRILDPVGSPGEKKGIHR